MKLACVTASRIPSSAANSIQVMKVCQAMAQIGHEITLLAPVNVEPFDAAREWRSLRAGRSTLNVDLSAYYGLKTAFPIERLPAHPRLGRYDFCWRAARRARALGAQAVYVWPLQAALFAALLGLPTLLELHEPPQGKLAPTLFRLYLRLPASKRILPITAALKRILDQSFPEMLNPSASSGQAVQRLTFNVSPDGVDLERYADLPTAAAARQMLGLADAPTAGYTGHLYPGRGMNLLAALARRFRHVRFLWVGGRPEDVESWRERLAAQGIGNVSLTGFVENSRLALYQAAADVLLMPYERSVSGSSGGNTADFCSPMKMFEYMACGRAILSSDLPVLREVLHERNAVFCPPEDEDAWANGLARLLANPAERAALGGQARRDVEGFTWVERQRKAVGSDQ